MQDIVSQLRELDDLYYTNLAVYEQQWQEVCRRIEELFPGMTLSQAEIYTQGQQRVPTGSMRHVLVPQPQESRIGN